LLIRKFEAALADEKGLIAFAHRHNQSLDWIVFGDVRYMVAYLAEGDRASLWLAESKRKPMNAKLARAIALRDAALAIVKAQGTSEIVSNMKLTTARIGDLQILYRSGPIGSQRLPYGLDLWAPKTVVTFKENDEGDVHLGVDTSRVLKVLNIEWNDQGRVQLVNYRAGDWELLFLKQN
jgi:hypothetical protein